MMLELSRTVRFCLNPDGSLAADASRGNTFAAWPPMRGLGRYYELRVDCRGEADPVTGYFMNIKRIDEAARDTALPLVAGAAQGIRPASLGMLMRDIITELDVSLDRSVIAAALRLTPTYTITIEAPHMDRVLIHQRYEFSAAHRLHADELSDEENAEIFGKCNNPAGHGHNYRLEVAVRSPVDSEGGVAAIEKIDDLINETVIENLDHKHLNLDVPQFADLNPSVENIARVIHGMLADEVKRLGVELDQVKVWETAKTACTYRG